MGIVASLKGLFRRADTGAAGPAVADPTQTSTGGVTSVPTNPGVQESPQTTQTEVSDSVLDPPSVEGSGLNPTVDPELGSETETPSASARESPVTEPDKSPAEEVKVKTSLTPESEEPTTSTKVEGAIPPSTPTASEAESQP